MLFNLIAASDCFSQNELLGQWQEKKAKNIITFETDSTILWKQERRACGTTQEVKITKKGGFKYRTKTIYDSTYFELRKGRYKQTSDSLITFLEGFSRRSYLLRIEKNNLYLSYWLKEDVPEKENFFVTEVFFRLSNTKNKIR